MKYFKIILKYIVIEFIKSATVQYLGIEQTFIDETLMVFEFIKNKVSL